MIVGSKYTYVILGTHGRDSIKRYPRNKLMLDLDNPRMYHHVLQIPLQLQLD